MPSATVSSSAAQARQGRVRLECDFSSDQGGRSQNEDSVDWFASEEGLLAIVADGMGGGVDGKRFSEQAVAAVRRGASAPGPRGEQQLRSAIYGAVREIRELRLSSQRYQNSGTTLLVANVTPMASEALAQIANIGDSRAYRVSASGQVQVLTRDHTYAERLISQGMSAEEAYRQREAKHLTHALGDDLSLDSVPQFMSAVRLRPGDCLLLCTDGVSKHIRDAELAAAVVGHSAIEAVTLLTRQAIRNGSRDNVTALAVYCRSARRAPPPHLYRALIATGLALAVGAGGLFAWSRARAGAEASPPPTLLGASGDATITPLPPDAPTATGNPSATLRATSTTGLTTTPTPTPTPTYTNTPVPTNTPRPQPPTPRPPVTNATPGAGNPNIPVPPTTPAPVPEQPTIPAPPPAQPTVAPTTVAAPTPVPPPPSVVDDLFKTQTPTQP